MVYTEFNRLRTGSDVNCKKGMPCGNSCISKSKKCKKDVGTAVAAIVNHVTDSPNLEQGAGSSGATAVTGENAGFTVDKNLEPVGDTPEDSEFTNDYNAWQSENRSENAEAGNRAKALNENAPPPTEVQAEAIREYTGSAYENINSYLRNGGEKLDKYEKEDARANAMLATEGLRGTPNYEGDTYRGTALRNSTIEKMEIGGTYTDKGFFSASADKNSADAFLEDGSGKPIETHTPTIFYIDSNKGKDVAPVSEIPQESEVLFEPSTPFKITDMVKEDGVLKVWLTDI